MVQTVCFYVNPWYVLNIFISCHNDLSISNKCELHIRKQCDYNHFYPLSFSIHITRNILNHDLFSSVAFSLSQTKLAIIYTSSLANESLGITSRNFFHITSILIITFNCSIRLQKHKRYNHSTCRNNINLGLILQNVQSYDHIFR